MTLARSTVIPGMVDEYRRFADLLRGLTADEWAMTTCCGGWAVADVAAHVVGTLTDVSNLQLDGLGTPEVTERQVDERRGRTPGELADELEASLKRASDLVAGFDEAAWSQRGPQPNGKSLGHGLETLWYDTFVHSGDIRAAVGQPRPSGPGVAASISHLADALTDRQWGPAALRFDGLEEFPVSGGGGQSIGGDPMEFVLAATGRVDPARIGLDETVNVYA